MSNLCFPVVFSGAPKLRDQIWPFKLLVFCVASVAFRDGFVPILVIVLNKRKL